MRAGLLTATFYLHGCNSLKEKRQRMAKLRDKFGKQTNLAVCESDYADVHKRAVWSFVAVAEAEVVVQQTLAEVERYVSTSLDAEVIDLQREWLA